MGNSATKESRTPPALSPTFPNSNRHAGASAGSGPSSSYHPAEDRPGEALYVSRGGRGNRQDVAVVGLGGGRERDTAILEPRRETKVEREARRLERERLARLEERERSVREEGVDGGYLVTLGTYTGPEDFSKPVVRQLMIERRLAPFWTGLNEHSESWTEHQLVAAAKGLPIPAPDEIPSEELKAETSPRSSDANINHLTVPISGRSASSNSDKSSVLSPSHPAFSVPSPTSPLSGPGPPSPLFRGRAKTLASLTTTSRNNSRTEMTPQEIQLPKDPFVNGQRVEAFLYKDASECPICFLYYPPHLNRTRCCDQPICSECFVQIKRPDPHPPEHVDPNTPDAMSSAQADEQDLLVSEPAACPFCVQPEFGVTFEPPPFRRGLAYVNQTYGSSLAMAASAMSSSSSLNSQGPASPTGGGRRRTTSLSASAPQVITTDRVRPDWAKKLSDARSHALRRAAAATALHNAAYVIGNTTMEGRGFGLGRRRRMFGTDSPNGSGQFTPRGGDPLHQASVGAFLRGSERLDSSAGGHADGQTDLLPGRHSSRRNRIEDLEELMMMEAIRLSIAAEEDRKRKEEKEAAKEAKKKGKKKAKEAKRVEKAQRNISRGFHPIALPDGGSATDLASGPGPADGKGKAVDRSEGVGFNPLSEPTSTVNDGSQAAPREEPRAHLEQSRANMVGDLHQDFSYASDGEPSGEQPSNPSSSGSSLSESISGSMPKGDGFGEMSSASGGGATSGGGSSEERAAIQTETATAAGSGSEPMFNFRSLAAVIGDEEKQNDDGDDNDDSAGKHNHTAEDIRHNHSLSAAPEQQSSGPEAEGGIRHRPGESSNRVFTSGVGNLSEQDGLTESTTTLKAGGSSTSFSNGEDQAMAEMTEEDHGLTDARPTQRGNGYDTKHCGDVRVLDTGQGRPVE